MDTPVVPGCVVRAKLIGAVKAEQKEKGGKWIRNDRLIAVAMHAQTHQKCENLSDLRPHLLTEIKEFFVEYNKLRDRKFRPEKDAGPAKARDLMKVGMKAFAQRRKKRG